jgi:hypothetical protein
LLRARLRLGSHGVRVALLVALTLLGFAAAYPLTSGSRAATGGSTTVPSPDLPPTTQPKPERPPPPPPPPAAPVHSYVAPPPPRITSQPRAVVVPKRVHRRRAVRHTRAKAKHVKKRALAAATPRPPRPRVGVATAPAASSLAPQRRRLSSAVELLLAFVIGLLLLSVVVAVAPRAVQPRPASELLERHREVVISLVSAVALGIATGLVVFALS